MLKAGALGGACVFVAALTLGPSADAAVALNLPAEHSLSGSRAMPRAALETEAQALAARWAPVFVQHTSPEHPERDRPLAVDFDGDWDATNNWTHLTPAARSAKPVVYSSAILTATHAYLTYTLFFPRDWEPILCLPYACHDNDLEVALVVVERGEQRDSAERLVLVETKAHLSYLAVPGRDIARGPDQRPLLEVESQGHGIYAVRRGAALDGERRLFAHTSAAAPSSSVDAPLERFELVSLHDSLWLHRHPSSAKGRLWSSGESGWLEYAGAREGRHGEAMGASMAGHEYPGGVRPPWGLRADGERGDWFLDPVLSTINRHRSWFPVNRPVGESYVLNDYLDDLKDECSGRDCAAPPTARSTLALSPVLVGLMLALGLASRRIRRRAA